MYTPYLDANLRLYGWSLPRLLRTSNKVYVLLRQTEPLSGSPVVIDTTKTKPMCATSRKSGVSYLLVLILHSRVLEVALRTSFKNLYLRISFGRKNLSESFARGKKNDGKPTGDQPGSLPLLLLLLFFPAESWPWVLLSVAWIRSLLGPFFMGPFTRNSLYRSFSPRYRSTLAWFCCGSLDSVPLSTDKEIDLGFLLLDLSRQFLFTNIKTKPNRWACWRQYIQ